MPMDIILYLLSIIQYQQKQIRWLFCFICRYIPLKQWSFDDSHSPKYQKFKIDKLPTIIYYEKWDYLDYIPYLEWRYGNKIKPVNHRRDCDIAYDCTCPHCNHSLVHKKDRKPFVIHECINPKCPYYLHNLKKVDKKTGRGLWKKQI